MGYDNPPVKWSELERRLSNRSRPGSDGAGQPDATLNVSFLQRCLKVPGTG